jgi:ANTAR domain-containing protein/GAF domain-containing protein
VNAERLASTFVELSDTLVEDFDLVEFLYTLVERCAELLDVSAVGLMLADARGRLTVMASTSEETRLLELFQLQNDQGPCLECSRSGHPVVEDDLATAHARWPRFAPAAVAAGFRSVHALPMRLRSETIGALNLFHAQPGALLASDVHIGQAMVDVATIGLVQNEIGRREILLSQLQTALNTRTAVEQAKGILAERNRITPAQAFTDLRAHARTDNIRLTDLAYAVIKRQAMVEPLLREVAADGPAQATRD